jgi:hypothetical protein
MIDLPTRSVIVGGLEHWEMRPDAFKAIPEPRLATRLEQLLKAQGRFDEGKSLSLRTPPVTDSRPGKLPSYILRHDLRYRQPDQDRQRHADADGHQHL